MWGKNCYFFPSFCIRLKSMTPMLFTMIPMIFMLFTKLTPNQKLSVQEIR